MRENGEAVPELFQPKKAPPELLLGGAVVFRGFRLGKREEEDNRNAQFI